MSIIRNNPERFRGRGFIVLARQSSDRDGTTSNAAQLQAMIDEAVQVGMVHVDDMSLEGVTGSIPGRRDDIEQLLRRKREKNDFDVLLIQRCDRSTRSGAEHGFWFEHECARAGIDIVFVGEDLPEDPRHAVWAKVAKYEAAYTQAESISQRSTQGWQLALQQSRVIPVARTPFGCDRLYLSADGTPLFRIRNYIDGSQVKLDLDGNDVLEKFSANARFRKQKDHLPLIVPGAAREAAVVRLIFVLHYEQLWGGKRIAGFLNQLGELTPTGKPWSQRTVESIYENPIYCGYALGNRTSQGIFYRRGKLMPERVDIGPRDLANAKSAPKQLRSPEEWQWVEQPPMLEFLPASIREKALSQIKEVHAERYRRSVDADRPKRSTNKHKDSEYILTGLLVAKQDGEKLSGTLEGKKGRKVRKYRHLKSARGYVKGRIFNNRIRAKELEDAVLELILDVIVDAQLLVERIQEAVAASSDYSQIEADLERAKAERDDVAKSVRRILMVLQDEDLVDVQDELARLRTRRRELDAQIEKWLFGVFRGLG